MAVQITIIGLGQTGASLGLALAAHKEKVFTIGHDKDYGMEQRAKKLGAVEETSHNLPTAVENADVVILAIPVHQIRETLGFIAEDLKKDALVVELSPVKKEVAKWMKELLPSHCHYVGLVPAISSVYLDLKETGLDSAKPDFFSKSVFLLSAPTGSAGEAVKLVSDLVSLLGATAVITDFVESDGLMATSYLLPQLISASLLDATINQGGWQDIRKIASREFYSASSALGASDSLSTFVLQNRENTISALDKIIHALLKLRDVLENKEEDSFKKHLQSAEQGRENWLNERAKGDWLGLPNQPVEKISFMETLFGSKLGKRITKGKDN
jgi:prephenate dehydrogenase